VKFAKWFLEKFAASIVAVLSCFDRVIFKGSLPGRLISSSTLTGGSIVRFRACRLALLSVVAATVFLAASRCPADIVYVDNVQGSDVFDGSSSTPFDQNSGPVKTVRRALQVARTGDTIVLANNGSPYYESVQLVGRRHSGYQHVKFTIIGNGAVLSGLRTVPPQAWRRVGADLWKMTPWRKGHYQLLLDGKPVPEQRVPRGARGLPKIPEGNWSAWRGSIYYQATHLDEPAQRPFQFAAEEVGLTFYKVHDVRIVDVTFRHFRLDGVNAHDFCRNIVLENVTSTENGRAGVSVGGTSEIVIRNSRLVGNRFEPLRISELGLVDVEQTEMDAPPTIVE